MELKTFYDSRQFFLFSRGGGVVIALASRSNVAQRGCVLNTDKPASGPLARRGSSPFPGATNMELRYAEATQQ